MYCIIQYCTSMYHSAMCLTKVRLTAHVDPGKEHAGGGRRIPLYKKPRFVNIYKEATPMYIFYFYMDTLIYIYMYTNICTV
jgi:hypothetical protein